MNAVCNKEFFPYKSMDKNIITAAPRGLFFLTTQWGANNEFNTYSHEESFI